MRNRVRLPAVTAGPWKRVGTPGLLVGMLVLALVAAGCGRQPPAQRQEGEGTAPRSLPAEDASASVAGSAAVHRGAAAADPPLPATIAELDEEGRREADRLAEAFPESPDAWEVKARVYLLLTRYDAAADYWERCLELNPDYYYAYHGLGLVAANFNRHEEAAAMHRKALERAPEFSDAAHELADALINLGEVDEAVAVLEGHLEVRPDSAFTEVYLGQAYLAAQRFEEAVAAFRRGLEGVPNIPRAQFGLATALTRLGRREEAARAMQEYRRLREEDNRAFDEFREQVTGFEQKARDYATRFTYAGRVYLAYGQADEAERLFRRAAQLNPWNTESRILLAMLYQQTGRPEEALDVCRALVEIAPEEAAYHLNLGVMYGNLGRTAEAAAALREAIRLEPENPEGHVSLARLHLFGEKDHAQAEVHARRALELAPTARHHLLLGEILAAAGQRPAALEAVGKAAELEPANPEYQALLRHLRTIEEGHASPAPP